MHHTASGIDVEVGQHERILLEAGLDGGRVGIAELNAGGAPVFVCFVNDCTPEFLSDADRENVQDHFDSPRQFQSWSAAVRELDQHPWWKFTPLAVAPDYREVIKEELKRKGVDLSVSLWGRCFE